MEGLSAIKKASLSRQKQETQSKAQKRSPSGKQTLALKKISKKRNSVAKIQMAKKSSVKNTNFRKIKRKIASIQSIGYKVSYVKRGSLFEKMKLKKDDIIRFIEGQSVDSKKQIYQMLSLLSKKKKKIDLFITRNKTNFLISYKIDSFKAKKRFFISNIQKIKSKGISAKKKNKKTTERWLAAAQNKGASKIKQSQSVSQSKEAPKTKKTLVPEKYKPHLQRAYVIALNSFVYEKPDFDAKHLYPLTVGRKILISKKIFRPPHNFGSFYKVFLFHEKKVVGYVSEAEVVPEFLKQNGKYTVHPAYKLAKKQIAQDKVLDVDLIDKAKQKNPPRRQQAPAETNNKKRYIGLSLGFLNDTFSTLTQKDIYIGLKLSGYNLLISYINMDLNLIAALDRKVFHFDILTAYPMLKSHPYHLFIMGGLNLDINKRIRIKDPIDYGFSGALSLVIPINQKLLLRMEAKTGYGLRTQSVWYGLLSSLQIAF